jgi:hypothetical protein
MLANNVFDSARPNLHILFPVTLPLGTLGLTAISFILLKSLRVISQTFSVAV